jgi:hypothetical protein
MDGDRIGPGALVGKERGGPAVCAGALAGIDVGIDGSAQDRVRESQRPRRGEDVGPGERHGELVRPLGREAGEGGDAARRRTVPEHRDGARERRGVGAQP